MSCDASKDELGCGLMQSMRVVAYGSLQLKNHEQSYSTHDMELATSVFTLKAWPHYLYGEQLEVFLDHKSLKCIFTQRNCNTPKYTLVLFNMFRVFCRYNLNFCNCYFAK